MRVIRSSSWPLIASIFTRRLLCVSAFSVSDRLVCCWRRRTKASARTIHTVSEIGESVWRTVKQLVSFLASVCLSVCLSVCPSVRPSVCLSVWLLLCICISSSSSSSYSLALCQSLSACLFHVTISFSVCLFLARLVLSGPCPPAATATCCSMLGGNQPELRVSGDYREYVAAHMMNHCHHRQCACCTLGSRE